MTALSERFKVGGVWWNLVLSDRISVDLDHWGLTTYKDLTVQIDSHSPRSKQGETLLHEIIHVAAQVLSGSLALREQQVKVIAPMLFAILRDNPDLVAFMMEEEEKGPG